jgi:predicted DNA binding CopG/RHH family protein
MDRGDIIEKKSNRITFRLTPSEVQSLIHVSSKSDMNVSQLIRTALKQTYKI